MIKVQTGQGEITISSAVFTTITGAAATNCFGVKGMAYRSMTDGLVHLLRREAMSKGVKVTYNEDGTVSIELHIVVENSVIANQNYFSRPAIMAFSALRNAEMEELMISEWIPTPQ